MKIKINPWYSELGLASNPFSIKPNNRFKIQGRDEAKKNIISHVKENGIVLIAGAFGSGKTTFLRSIIRPFGGKKQVIYFACNRLNAGLDIDRLLYDRFGLITKVFRIKSKQMILLLDEADHLTKSDLKTINDYYKNGYLKSVLFVTHNSLELPAFFKNRLLTVDFNELEHQSIIGIVRERIGEHELLTDDVIIELYETDKRIRFFLKNCEMFMKYMVEKKRRSAKPKDVSKALNNALSIT